MLPAALPFQYLPRTLRGDRIRRSPFLPHGRRVRRGRPDEAGD